MTRLAIVVVVIWPRSPLARDEQGRAPVAAARQAPHAKHAPRRAARTVVFSHPTPDGPRIKMVTGHDE